jgi:hypothetical protein
MEERERPGDVQRSDQRPAGPAQPDPPDAGVRAPQDGLSEDELRWVSGGTEPTEDEPFLPG